MDATRLVVSLLAAAVMLAGCSDSGSRLGDRQPKSWVFDLYVHASPSDTISLYEKNDGSYSKAVAVAFEATESTPDGQQMSVPGPEIRVVEGDSVTIVVHNNNPLSHTFHLHGGLVPWEEDGVDYLTQFPIPQGASHTYHFENMKAGTYWYHCHVDSGHHIDLGMYGAFIVEEQHPDHPYDKDFVVMLDEWDNCHVHGNADPLTGQEPTPDTQAQTECYYRYLLDNLAQNSAITNTGATVNSTVPDAVKDTYCPALRTATAQVPEPERTNVLTASGCVAAHAHGATPPQQTPRSWWYETHPVYNPLHNTFLVNGKAFPDTPVFPVEQGKTYRFRIINVGNEFHTWHPHGHNMLVTHKDGYQLEAPYYADTLAIGPGERYDVTMVMDNPGLWMVHDQSGTYTVNDDVHPGGMMACIAYNGFEGVDANALGRALDCHTEAVRILEARGEEHHHG